MKLVLIFAFWLLGWWGGSEIDLWDLGGVDL